MKAARTPAILVILAVLIVGFWAGPDKVDPEQTAGATAAGAPAAVAKADALSALWFCNGGTALDGGLADHRVVLSNTTGEARSGTITTMASTLADGSRPTPARKGWELPAYERAEFRLADEIGQAPYASATIEVSGGGVLVEHTIAGPLGNDSGPCISSASPHWFVPLGTTSTIENSPVAREILVFYNPFQGDAVIEAEFSTDSGFRDSPEVFKGLVVPGSSVVAVDLATAAVAVADQVAATITARSGRVVVDRIQVFDDDFRRGLAVSSAVPDTALTWVFPVGQLGAGRRERLVVYNPSTVVAEVDVEVRPEDPTMGVEPFQLTVQPRQHSQIDLDTESRLTALVESNAPYSIIVRSVDGNPVSAERIVTVAPGSVGAGVATSTGSAYGATKLFAPFATNELSSSSLVVVNPSLVAVSRISLEVVSGATVSPPVAKYQNLELQPGDRLTVAVAELLGAAGTVIIHASEQVVAERDLVNETERSLAIAVPDAAASGILDVGAAGVGASQSSASSTSGGS